MRNSWAKFAFYWGSVFGAVVFLYQLLSALLGFSSTFFQTLLYSFFIVFTLIFVLGKYRKQNNVQFLAFGQSLKILTIVSLVMSAFFALFTFVLISKLQPTLLQEAMNQYITLLEGQDIEVPEFEDENMFGILQVAFVITSFVSDFVGNFFYALFISFMFSRRLDGRMPLNNNQNQENNTDEQ